MHQELCSAWMVTHLREQHDTYVTRNDFTSQDVVTGLKPFYTMTICSTCDKQHSQPEYIEAHEPVCLRIHETYQRWHKDDTASEDKWYSSDSPDTASHVNAIDHVHTVRALHDATTRPTMEKFYYDQKAELSRRPFDVDTYGDIVKCVREADDERLRVFLSAPLSAGIYDARDEDGRVRVQFSVGFHPQDYKRRHYPPLLSAKNPMGFAWQATMLSAHASPAHVASMIYIMFPVRGTFDVMFRDDEVIRAKIEITDDDLYDDVCVMSIFLYLLCLIYVSNFLFHKFLPYYHHVGHFTRVNHLFTT